MPQCGKCQTELTEKNWFKSLMKKHHQICKLCNHERTMQWRKRNPEMALAISRRSNQQTKKLKPHYSMHWSRKERVRRRIELINAYGGRCARCGIDEPIVLDIDHIHDDGHLERKNGFHGWRLYRKLRKAGYPKDRYQLLCKNCNWKKEMERRVRNRKCAEVIGRAIMQADSLVRTNL